MNVYKQRFDAYSRTLKKRLVVSRLVGILACLVGIACIVLFALYHKETQWQWLCLIMLAYSLGTIFMQNCNLQAIKNGNPWQRINGFCSLMLYALDIFILVYSLVKGYIVLF